MTMDSGGEIDMAGDWIKFETATLDKPEVCQIADAADIDVDAVIGKLLRVWAWFDEQTSDGNAPSVSKRLLDRLVGVQNFCNHMVSVGWLSDDGTSIFIPNFERHNGKTAKTRLLTNRRVANHYANANAESNDASVREPLTKEDIDKDKDQKTKSTPTPKTRKPKIQPEDVQLPAWMPMQEWADYIEMRRVKKKPVTPSIAIRVIKKLEGMAKAGHNIAIALENSIVNCWTDIYEPKVDFNGSGQQTNSSASRPSRPSLIDQVNAAAAEQERRRQLSLQPPPIDERDWPEFASIREIDGSVVGVDD